MALDFGAVKTEAAAILRDEDGVYSNEIEHGLRYAVRILRRQGILDTEHEIILTLPANVWKLPLEQFGTGEIIQMDWSPETENPRLWEKLEKSPYHGGELSILEPPVGRPYRWSQWGHMIVFDGSWGEESYLRAATERSFAEGGNPSDGSSRPQASLPAGISEDCYDATLQLCVAYVQMNYLNLDASAAQGQAQAAAQSLLEARDRQLSSGTLQPFVY